MLSSIRLTIMKRSLQIPLALTVLLVPLRAEQVKPNILFIMSDDHATQAIGAYGSRLAALNPTPNIDKLAKQGLRFDRVFCNNSICTPSRASILTGQYPQSNGVLVLGEPLPPVKQYLPNEIRKLGYQTAMIGKWHLSREPAAFDYYCVLRDQGRYFSPIFRVRGKESWPKNTIQMKGKHSSDAITNLSLDWLEKKRDKTKPFFLMHHFKAPHDMFRNAPRYDNYLEDIDIPKPTNLKSPPQGSIATKNLGSGLTKNAPWKLGMRLKIPDDLEGEAYREACYQKYLKRYLRCVKGVDDNIGRLLDYLEKTGELENTLIIYTSDQGFLLGEHDLMDKRWIYEESMRMPFIAHWPEGINPELNGAVNKWLINNTDFAPTLLQVAGSKKIPDYMQGKSFASALQAASKPTDWRKVTYYRYWMHLAHDLEVPAHFGVRSDRYKLVFYYGQHLDPNNKGTKTTPAAWEFYDLEKDPHEMKNQINNPEYASLVTKMKIQLNETRNKLKETDKNYPHIRKIYEAAQ